MLALVWIRAVLWTVAVASLWTQRTSCQGLQVSVNDCEGQKIAILDLSDLAGTGNYPKCQLEEVVQVNMGNGIAYSRKHEIEQQAPHMFGTHAAPWYLYEAIKASKYYTPILEEADIVFVYDYCYYIWWLGDVHSFGRDHADGPGDHLVQAYATMFKLPAWRKFNGGTFAFYDPHPGFMAGKAADPVQKMKCSTFRNAIHMIVDTPMRNICEGFWLIKKILVTPYFPNLLDPKEPEKYLRRPLLEAKDRSTLAYSRSKCHPWEDENAGKRMRYWYSYTEWGASKDIDVKCTDTELNPEGHSSFPDMYAKMQKAKFCPAFPGDAASTRRLSEIFLAGCIPVFLGPPYHSMPFGDTVPYAELAVFFDIKNHSMWMREEANWKLHPTIRSVHETESRWWVPDVDIPTSNYIKVDQPHEVLAHLKGMPESEVNRKLQLMHQHGSRFSFLQKITEPPNAVNSLLSGMCKKQRAHPPRLAKGRTHREGVGR